MKKILTLLLTVTLIFSLCACGEEKIETTPPAAVVEEESVAEVSAETETYAIKYNVKINPEFTVCADENLCVTEIIAENEDAQVVLDNVDALGLSVSDAFVLLTEEAKEQGYMTQEKGNTVDITIMEKDEEEMPTCHICGGCGTILCLECNGTGIFGACDMCKGEGSIHIEAGPQCPFCGGNGICHDCGGSGKIVVTNGEDGGVVYVSEGVAEMGQCPDCHGDGVCSNCHGGDYSIAAHDIECEGCHGTGIIYCHDDLNGYRWCPCCWGSGVDGTGDPDYESWMKENGY